MDGIAETDWLIRVVVTQWCFEICADIIGSLGSWWGFFFIGLWLNCWHSRNVAKFRDSHYQSWSWRRCRRSRGISARMRLSQCCNCYWSCLCQSSMRGDLPLLQLAIPTMPPQICWTASACNKFPICTWYGQLGIFSVKPEDGTEG